MVRRAHRQRSVFEVLLPDGDKLWDPALQRIDAARQSLRSGRGVRLEDTEG